MGQDTGEPAGTSLDLLVRLHELERRRTDELIRYLNWQESALARIARIEGRLTALETSLSRRLTAEQWAKIAIGFGLPIAALLLTGNVEAARRLLGLLP